MMDDDIVQRLPVDHESIDFDGWKISYEKSHILKSICKSDNCQKDNADCCELCTYRYALQLPNLPDMVFHKNKLRLCHKSGAVLEFMPMDALRRVENGKQLLQVACAQEWKESRTECPLEEKTKPFDWTFTTDYQGTLNDQFRIEESQQQLNKIKLMQRERILFYHDLTLFEDELHDNGISLSSVKIRVMPSGFFILLRHFLRVDDVLIKMHSTRFHYEIGNDYILREFTKHEAKYDELKTVTPLTPNDIENNLPAKIKNTHMLYF